MISFTNVSLTGPGHLAYVVNVIGVRPILLARTKDTLKPFSLPVAQHPSQSVHVVFLLGLSHEAGLAESEASCPMGVGSTLG